MEDIMENSYSLYLCYKRTDMVLSKEKPSYVCPSWVSDKNYTANFARVGFQNIFCKLGDGSTVITTIPFLLGVSNGLANIPEEREMANICRQIASIKEPDLSYRIYNLAGNDIDVICLDDILPSDWSSYEVVGFEIKDLRITETLS
jgi:hypothetical protein